MSAPASYYLMLERTEYYFLVLLVILSIIVLFFCPEERRFKFGLNLNIFLASFTFAFFLAGYARLCPNLNYETFDIPGFSTTDIYTFGEIKNINIFLQGSFLLSMISIWFLIKTFTSIAYRSSTNREWITVFLLVMIFLTSIRPFNLIYRTKKVMTARLQEENNTFLAKLLETEEKTKSDAENHPEYWGAQYMRAQYLYFTNRKPESVPFYEKTLELLGDDEGQVDEFIKERLQELKKR